MCFLSISTCSSTLLGIVFKTLGYRSMDHEPDIFLVDSKAKCDCCYDDLNIVSHPSNLNLLAVFICHLCMIELAFNAIKVEFATQLFALLSRETINDPTHVCKLLLKKH